LGTKLETIKERQIDGDVNGDEIGASPFDMNMDELSIDRQVNAIIKISNDDVFSFRSMKLWR
jgi:hypothetical protein